MKNPSAEQPKQKQSTSAYGHPITMTMAYAKDLKVAEINANANKTGVNLVTDEDLEDIVRWADFMNNKICERINCGA